MTILWLELVEVRSL